VRWPDSLCAVLRVLLVDDHAATRRAIRNLLRLRGFEVIGEAGCAATALAVAAEHAPDAVLLDVRLGDEDGYCVCRALVSALPDVTVVLTSSDDECHVRGLARSAGANGFVSKARLHEADLRAMFTRGV
jgi:DNA-binding NarL/FixJ family response regulator